MILQRFGHLMEDQWILQIVQYGTIAHVNLKKCNN